MTNQIRNEVRTSKRELFMKTKLHSLFLVLALFAGVHPALAQPTLSIAPAGNQSVLFWPLSFTIYVLQGTTNLATPNWVAATDAVPVTAVTVSNTAPARFFRLAAGPAGMALIPAGAFTMGDTLDGLGNAVPVSVNLSAFYMDVNEVTLSQWQAVYFWASLVGGYTFANGHAGKAGDHPVQTVNWYDCVKWSNARSQQAGLTQVYTNGEPATLFPNWSAAGYRLPTEAEWEKAARGGLSGQRFPWGNLIGESQANYYGSTASFGYDLGPNSYNAIGSIGGTSPATSPVGSFPANGYGLNDMAGNVIEWCWDWYGTPYAGGSDPHGPTGPLSLRVLRGGDWGLDASSARCPYRRGSSPADAGFSVGFRCVRGL